MSHTSQEIGTILQQITRNLDVIAAHKTHLRRMIPRLTGDDLATAQLLWTQQLKLEQMQLTLLKKAHHVLDVHQELLNQS